LLSPRTIAIASAAATLALCIGCNRPAKPPRGGHGPHALEGRQPVDAPTYHKPLKAWEEGHGAAINRRVRSQYQCVLCHDPERHCNRCHRHMGVRRAIMRPPPLSVTLTAKPLPKPALSKP